MTVARLALHDWWVSFRLVLVLAGFVLAAAVVGLLASDTRTSLLRLALGMAAAGTLAGALLAWSFAVERRRGRAAWLVSRAVQRRALIGGWLLAAAFSVTLAIVPSAVVAWVSLPSGGGLEPTVFGLAMLAVACTTVLLLAFGLLAGTLLPPLVAGAAVVLAGSALGGVVVLRPDVVAVVPGAAFGLLATLDEASRPVARSVTAAGTALAAASILLVVAAVALERRDL